jgi:hypothetical protein
VVALSGSGCAWRLQCFRRSHRFILGLARLWRPRGTCSHALSRNCAREPYLDLPDPGGRGVQLALDDSGKLISLQYGSLQYRSLQYRSPQYRSPQA